MLLQLSNDILCHVLDFFTLCDIEQFAQTHTVFTNNKVGLYKNITCITPKQHPQFTSLSGLAVNCYLLQNLSTLELQNCTNAMLAVFAANCPFVEKGTC